MKTRQERRKAYLKLETTVIVISGNDHLLTSSPVNGGHKNADDDGEELNAKEFEFVGNEGEFSASNN